LPTKTPSKKPKKKRGIPKASTNKPKKLKAKVQKVKKSPSETGLTLSKVAEEAPPTKPSEQKPAPPTKPAESFSDKYRQDRIFRREMGEPEFWIGKKGLVTLRPMRTKEEEQEISRKVLIPIIQSTPYSPEYILSPEFQGTSSYELGIDSLKQEWEEKLQRIKANPDSSTQQLTQTEKDLKTLDYLYSNFYNGMNVFRTAKGGRDKLRK